MYNTFHNFTTLTKLHETVQIIPQLYKPVTNLHKTNKIFSTTFTQQTFTNLYTTLQNFTTNQTQLYTILQELNTTLHNSTQHLQKIFTQLYKRLYTTLHNFKKKTKLDNTLQHPTQLYTCYKPFYTTLHNNR